MEATWNNLHQAVSLRYIYDRQTEAYAPNSYGLHMYYLSINASKDV